MDEHLKRLAGGFGSDSTWVKRFFDYAPCSCGAPHGRRPLCLWRNTNHTKITTGKPNKIQREKI